MCLKILHLNQEFQAKVNNLILLKSLILWMNNDEHWNLL